MTSARALHRCCAFRRGAGGEPAPRRVRGYYAPPLLRRDAVIGWSNVSVQGGRLVPEFGYVSGRAPRDAGCFRRELEAELDRMRVFLGL